MNMNTNLHNYYAQRAAHYEEIYQFPERQTELIGIATQLQHLLKDKKVLEVACGTGYWTELYAAIASQVVATDVNAEMLAIARAKQMPAERVSFQEADAFALPDGDFNACVAGFWWSHVKRSEQSAFLEGLQKTCGSGSVFVMFDNCYVEGSSTPIARTDMEGNTYQIRRLPDDSRHEVIKNFPTDSTLRKKLTQHARDIRVVRGTYYWMLTGVLR
ncbi:class I SAM-dependent methyltransferase [Solimicrobium silvestre]|uniref:Methyltransferase domain n=1 Tax=Solimicrobium silvestre TaxID=2099400 RepID=A0A2S9GYN5_9BURK|nr:class I SAM-dependent methyltransferase [Solimicrobium silvestre]PRC92837.1 Methyltransferase domain [Solimicrobium silvestre]